MTTTQMEINPQLVKQLREKTNAGFMDCKNALNECQGNMESVVDTLRKKGAKVPRKRSSSRKSGATLRR